MKKTRKKTKDVVPFCLLLFVVLGFVNAQDDDWDNICHSEGGERQADCSNSCGNDRRQLLYFINLSLPTYTAWVLENNLE